MAELPLYSLTKWFKNMLFDWLNCCCFPRKSGLKFEDPSWLVELSLCWNLETLLVMFEFDKVIQNLLGDTSWLVELPLCFLAEWFKIRGHFFVGRIVFVFFGKGVLETGDVASFLRKKMWICQRVMILLTCFYIYQLPLPLLVISCAHENLTLKFQSLLKM